MIYRPERQELVDRFIDLCVELVARGVPATVVVATESAKVGQPGDCESGTAAMRAFLGTVASFELVYERLIRTPPGVPTREHRPDVVEAVLDHPLYREAASRIDRGVFDRLPTNLDLLPTARHRRRGPRAVLLGGHSETARDAASRRPPRVLRYWGCRTFRVGIVVVTVLNGRSQGESVRKADRDLRTLPLRSSLRLYAESLLELGKLPNFALDGRLRGCPKAVTG